MRKFKNTHPWISFRLNFEKASPELWIKLGEASSKCEHIAGVPLQPSTQKRMLQVYLAKGVAATTAIEGNTLSEEQVLKRIEGNLELPKSQSYLQQEIDNIIKACNEIGEQIFSSESNIKPITPDLVKHYNKLVLEGLKLEEDVAPGIVRTHSVLVGNVYRGAPPEDCEHLLLNLCEWLDSEDFQPPKKSLRTVYSIIKAIIAHVYTAWIHPFGDGNGRTARLIEFHILLSGGLPMPVAHLLSNHYNQTRTEYYRQLDKASRSGGDLLPFIKYATDGLVDGLKEQISEILTQQWNVSWINYIHDVFRQKEKKAEVRQRRLALDISASSEPVPLNEVSTVTARVAQIYANLHIKTLRNDLNALVTLGIIESTPEGFRARKEIILAFLPQRADSL